METNFIKEQELVEAFEEHTGYELELEDVNSWIAFQAFCAGYKLKEKENERI